MEYLKQEEDNYLKENFNLSYPSKQQEARKYIIRLRALKGLSLMELAQLTGLEMEQLEDMEMGNKNICLIDFLKIVEACGVFEYLRLKHK